MIYDHGAYKACKADKECAKCKLKDPEPQNILLECGQGTGSRTFASANDMPFQLAYVIVDTCSLRNPTVNIECSSILTFDILGFAPVVRLRYELFRVWGDGMAESVGIWAITRVDQNTRKVTESFDFTFCEPVECKVGCCTYFVKVTPIEMFNSQVRIGNGRMAALIQGG